MDLMETGIFSLYATLVPITGWNISERKAFNAVAFFSICDVIGTEREESGKRTATVTQCVTSADFTERLQRI